MPDWYITGMPEWRTGDQWTLPRITLEIEPCDGNRRKGGKQSFEITPERLKALHDLTDKMLKEMAAAPTIQKELEEYREHPHEPREEWD
jgi:hypothetical protein